MCSNFVDDDVTLGGFDGNYDECDEQFVWVVVLGGRVCDMLVQDVYAIQLICEDECVCVFSLLGVTHYN